MILFIKKWDKRESGNRAEGSVQILEVSIFFLNSGFA